MFGFKPRTPVSGMGSWEQLLDRADQAGVEATTGAPRKRKFFGQGGFFSEQPDGSTFVDRLLAAGAIANGDWQAGLGYRRSIADDTQRRRERATELSQAEAREQIAAEGRLMQQQQMDADINALAGNSPQTAALLRQSPEKAFGALSERLSPYTIAPGQVRMNAGPGGGMVGSSQRFEMGDDLVDVDPVTGEATVLYRRGPSYSDETARLRAQTDARQGDARISLDREEAGFRRRQATQQPGMGAPAVSSGMQAIERELRRRGLM